MIQPTIDSDLITFKKNRFNLFALELSQQIIEMHEVATFFYYSAHFFVALLLMHHIIRAFLFYPVCSYDQYHFEISSSTGQLFPL